MLVRSITEIQSLQVEQTVTAISQIAENWVQHELIMMNAYEYVIRNV